MELKEKNDDELLKRKQECQKYLSKMNTSDSFSNFGNENWIFSDRIFYSEVKNSCIYQSKWVWVKWNKTWISQCFQTKDALTNEEYDNMCFINSDEKMEKAEERYENIYENWRSIENFDKALQKLESKSPN